MCAIDAIGAAFTFHQDTEVSSVSAVSGEPVFVKIIDGKVAEYSPKELHARHSRSAKCQTGQVPAEML